MLDISVGYVKYQFLGSEFLTWLWFLIENPQNSAPFGDHQVPQLLLGDRVVLENRSGETLETITIKGDNAGLEEGYLALKKGSHVSEMNIVCRLADQAWRFTIKGENLALTNFKTPFIGKTSNSEEIEGALLEKANLYETAFQWIDTLFNAFLNARLSQKWASRWVPDVRNWILRKVKSG